MNNIADDIQKTYDSGYHEGYLMGKADAALERPATNYDRIRGMSDEELATEITKNPSIPCRMCEYYNHKLGCCDAQRDFACVTAYAEALALDWLKQPVKEDEK